VFIDGALVGAPQGWAARPDLTALFPAAQYPGIGRALGVFGLDTTALANGLHTIAWSSTTNTGFTAGIASHFFTVANGALMLNARAASPAAASASPTSPTVSRVVAAVPPAAASLAAATLTADDVDALPPDDTSVGGRRGFDMTAPLQPYDVVNGSVTVPDEELDRIELQFGAAVSGAAINGAAMGGAASGRSYVAYLRTPSGLSPLPIGSRFDGAAGVFVWQPGVGFVGAYQFVFLRLANGQPVAKTEVRIILNPKRTGRVGAQTVIDAPAANAPGGGPTIVSASGFAVTGWASDFNSTIDNGVDVVHVWGYRVDGQGNPDPAFLGPALVGGNRPDVGALYGARFARSGYGLVVNSLPPGTYDIAVFAYSTVSNSFAPAQTVRVVVK